MSKTLEKLRDQRRALERQLQDVSINIGAAERALEKVREEALTSEGFPRPYWSDDYAGIEGTRNAPGFYFGYEHTVCQKHKDCTCRDKEWAFAVLGEGGKALMEIPKSKLNVAAGSPMERYLLAGIAALVRQGRLVFVEAPEETK